jgi:hypothetical protein
MASRKIKNRRGKAVEKVVEAEVGQAIRLSLSRTYGQICFFWRSTNFYLCQ